MVSCDVITDLMVVYESGEASAETRRLVDEHLAGCPVCRNAFTKGARVESTLGRSKANRDERPVNGWRFVSRTRRLFFLVGAGVLLFFAAHAALVARLTVKGTVGARFGLMPGASHAPIPVSPVLMLAVVAGAAAAYIALVLSRAPKFGDSRSGAIAKAVVGSALLAVLAFSTFYIWVLGPATPGLVALLLLLAALVVTVARLSKLPYFTIATVVSLFIAIVVLLNAVLLSRMMGKW